MNNKEQLRNLKQQRAKSYYYFRKIILENGQKERLEKQLEHFGFWSGEVVSISSILDGVKRHLGNRIDMIHN